MAELKKENIADIKLREEVSKVYELDPKAPREFIHTGLGRIDLSKIDLNKADRLYESGNRFLQKKTEKKG